jgi:hypothetical protein
MATASAGRATRVRRRLPRVARALVARRSRGLRAGQGRGKAHGPTAQLLRSNAPYAATGGGMGPGTIAALEALLVDIAMLPDALFCSAADANGPGDRFVDRHQSLARQFGIPFTRRRPPIEGGDWNDVLRDLA